MIPNETQTQGASMSVGSPVPGEGSKPVEVTSPGGAAPMPSSSTAGTEGY